MSGESPIEPTREEPGHKGETLLQATNPDKIVDHRPQVCLGCGGALGPDMAP